MADEYLVYGADFRRWLERHDTTYEAAARIFNVTSKTIRQWIKNGPEGMAAHFIGYLIKLEIPPRHISDVLHLDMTTIRRSQTKARNTAPKDDLRSRVTTYLFKYDFPVAVRAIQQNYRGEFSADEIRSMLRMLVTEEIAEEKDDQYTLAPYARLKIKTAKEAVAVP